MARGLVQVSFKQRKSVLFDTDNKLVHYSAKGNSVTLPLIKLSGVQDPDLLAAVRLSKQILCEVNLGSHKENQPRAGTARGQIKRKSSFRASRSKVESSHRNLHK
jgi:hypothetical protein